MKKIVIILFLLIPLLAGATDYYVKTSGNDSNTGLSDAQAWKTITKVNTEWASGKFIPGDRIYFNRGDIFTGTLTVASSGSPIANITIGAYGTGLPPRISGFTVVASWTSEGSGIYSATIHPQSFPNMFTIDGISYAKGRWPNDTWMSIDSRTSTSITDAALPASPDWDGAEIVIRKNAWIIDRTTITNHTGTSIGFQDVGYPPVAGWGYFIQNHFQTLDRYGEWYYDGLKIYVYFGTVNPATVTAKYSSRDVNLTIQAKNYLTVKGITFEGANASGIYISSSDYVTIQECKIQYCGDAAIDGAHNGGNNSLGFRAINDTIYHAQNQGIVLFGEFDGATISGCKLDSIGMFPGMNFNGDGQNNAIKLHGSNHIVEYNRIKDVGYNGIDFGGNQVKVRYNFIDGFGSVKDDVGGIYTTCFGTLWIGREINNNIVLNGWGALGGRLSTEAPTTTGIYADQREANLTISGNTVYNVYNGIILKNAHECQVFGNTVYAAKDIALYLQHDNYFKQDPTRNLEIFNNKFLTIGPWAADANAHGYVMYSRLGTLDNYLFGQADNNIICRFFGETTAPYYLIKLMGADWNGSFFSLNQWKLKSGEDQNSTGNLGGSPADEDELHFIYNSLRVNNTFTLSAAMQDVAGVSYSGTITLPPFTSLVLIGSGTITDNVDPGQLPSSYPVVQSFLSGITDSTAYVGATITDDGGSTVTARGICWSTSINPDLTDDYSSNGTGTGTFYHTITGLEPSTNYYVRAYATNSTGTGYSANMLFTTSGVPGGVFIKYEDEFVGHEGEFVKQEEIE